MSLDAYPWLKALHVAAAITFVGGVLGVAVYLTAQKVDDAISEASLGVHRIIRAWDRAVTTPAMLVVWAVGVTLALRGGWFASGWLPIKLVLVVILSAIHGVQSGRLRRLAGGAEPRSWPRAAGPLILSLVVVIAVMVVVKPF